MDNLGSSNPQRDHRDVPIPLEGDAEKPVRSEENPASGTPNVSRTPLNLGGGTGAPVAAPVQTPKPPTAAPAQAPRPAAAAPVQAPRPAAPPAAAVPAPRPLAPRPVVPKPVPTTGAGDRITSCKTFFTKLHPGAIKFLEEQITAWLKENPTVFIKRTNVIMGEVQEKKTEPNIVIVVWY